MHITAIVALKSRRRGGKKNAFIGMSVMDAREEQIRSRLKIEAKYRNDKGL